MERLAFSEGGSMIIALVVLFTIFSLAVFWVSLRALWFSWALSVFSGKREEVAAFAILCLVILAGYVAVMRLLLGK
jgi:hypothetical protein